MKLWCRHDWGKWSGVINDYNGTRYQYRSCKKCNKIIRRRAFWNNSITDVDINNSVRSNNEN